MEDCDAVALTRAGDHAARLADPVRLLALQNSGLTDGLPEEALDRITRLAAKLVGVPVALFSVVTDQRQVFKSLQGMTGPYAEQRQTPLSHSFCQHVVSSDRPLVVPDALSTELVRDNGAVMDMGVIAYLGIPIHGPRGDILGSLCAIDSIPRDWSDEQVRIMTDLAAILENELALRETVAQRQLLLAEMNHRIKNLLTIVSSMVRISRREHDDTEDMAAELEQRLQALATAHRLILPAAEMRAEPVATVALTDLLKALIAPYRRGIEIAGDAVSLGPKSVTSLTLALHEMLTNSAKYGALSDGRGLLSVRWTAADGALTIDWLDRGAETLPAQQTERGGFGSQLLEVTLAGQLQGKVEDLTDDQGFARRIVIPLSVLAD